MKNFWFAITTAAVLALFGGALAIDLWFYAAPEDGNLIAAQMPGATQLLIQLLLDDTRQNVALNLSVLGAAVFFVTYPNSAGNLAFRIACLLLVALCSLSSIFCSIIVTTAIADMLNLHLFNLYHPWLIWPVKLQHLLLVVSAALLSIFAIYTLMFPSSNR